MRGVACALLLRLRGRQDGVPDGATAIAYGRDERVTDKALLAVSLVELVAVHLLLPWPLVRLVLLVVSALGCLLLLALLADTTVRPHVLATHGLRLRAGSAVDVTVPLDAVAGVALRRADAARRVALDGDALVLGSGGQTQVELELSRSLPVRAGRVSGTARVVRFSADDPAAAVAAVRAGCRAAG